MPKPDAEAKLSKPMSDPPAPYRRPDVRPPLTDAERRWFTKQGDVEKGPFTADVVAVSVKRGMLKRTSLVRAEDETGWRPLGSVDALVAALGGTSLARRGTSDADPREWAALVDEGTFLGGFAAGFIGGIIGYLLVRRIAEGEETKRGALFGFGLQAAIWILLRVMTSMR